MSSNTPRLGLPLLQAGQAQKEIYHNEALAALDGLVQPVAETAGGNTPPASPATGKSWIVGTAPIGDWAGHAGALAQWSDAGWRFTAPIEGMCCWVAASGLWARRLGGSWTLGTMPASSILVGGVQVVGSRQAAIAAPSGGTSVDAEARSAIAAVLTALRTHGLIAT